MALSPKRTHFISLFLTLTAISLLFFTTRSNDFFSDINLLTSDVLSLLLKLLGYPVAQKNDIIRFGTLQVQIITECTAFYLALLYSCFVVSYPATWKRKIIGLGTGLMLLFAVNQMRLVLVFIVGTYDASLFHQVHTYFGQILMIGVTFILTLTYVSLANSENPKTADPRSVGTGKRTTSSASLRTLLSFSLRFIAAGVPLFWVWSYVSSAYINTIHQLSKDILVKTGMNLPHILPAPGSHWQTYNIVAFASLAIAVRPLALKKRMLLLISGSLLLCSLHLGTEISCFLIVLRNKGGLSWVIFSMLGQYLYPFIFWIWFSRNSTKNV